MERNIVDTNTLAKFLEVDVYTIRKYEEEASKLNLSFRKGRGKYDFVIAMKFIIRKYKKELENKDIVTRPVIADLLGYNEKYISELEQKYSLPKKDFNQYVIKDVVKWYGEHIKNITASGELERETIRLKKAQAEKFELDNAKERGLLMYKEDIIRINGQVFSNIRNRMLSLPNKMAHLVFGSKNLKEAKIKIGKLVNEVLADLSDPKILFGKEKHK